MDKLNWYVAYVQSCMERKAAEVLSRMGFECYVPIVREVHRWSDRNKIVERLVLPHMIFIHVTDADHKKPLQALSYVRSYVSIRGTGRPAVIPDEEMEAFRSMVDKGGRNVTVSSVPLAKGDKVRVTSGPLTGTVCELVSVADRKCLAVGLGVLGTALIELSVDTLEKI